MQVTILIFMDMSDEKQVAFVQSIEKILLIDEAMGGILAIVIILLIHFRIVQPVMNTRDG